MAIPIPIQLRLHPKEKQLPCTRNYQSDGTYPCYYKIDTFAFNGTRYKSVIYEIHYPKNLAVGLNGAMPNNSSLGYHNLDTERVIILHDLASDIPKYIFVSAHAQEGKWFEYSKCKIDNGRVVIYAALNSHRNAIKPKTHWRMFGFANDYTSDNGKHIDMNMIEDKDISYKAWNKEVLDSSFRAFFLPLYTGVLPKRKKKQQERDARVNQGV